MCEQQGTGFNKGLDLNDVYNSLSWEESVALEDRPAVSAQQMLLAVSVIEDIFGGKG